MNATTRRSGLITLALLAVTPLAMASSIYNPDNPDWTTYQGPGKAASPNPTQAATSVRIGVPGSQKLIELKDGSAVYVFRDGRMGMEDRYGNPVRMSPGATMETKDGQRVIMMGDETARVQSIKSRESSN